MLKLANSIITFIESVAFIALVLGIALIGGSEFQTTSEAFAAQFKTSVLISLACMALIILMEVLKYGLFGRRFEDM